MIQSYYIVHSDLASDLAIDTATQRGAAVEMGMKLRGLLRTLGQKVRTGHPETGKGKDRRKAKRTALPDTSGVKDVALGKKGGKKKAKLPAASLPKDVHVTLSEEEHKAEEQKNRKALKKKLKQDKDDPFGFSIDLPSVGHDEVHETIAVCLPQLGAACRELKAAMRVKDISATGIGLKYEGPRVKGGTVLTLILATKKSRLITGLKAKVMRHEKGVLGARFQDLNRQQENMLSKIVLEGQKRQRNMRKKRGLPKEIQDLKI